jgi:hypothetical protein
MSIEAYLARLAGSLTVAPAARAQILQEVRDHLEDAVYHLLCGAGLPASAGEGKRRLTY